MRQLFFLIHCFQYLILTNKKRILFQKKVHEKLLIKKDYFTTVTFVA